MSGAHRSPLLRIVHLVPALTAGGGERVAVELARHAALEGHRVTLLLAYPTDTSATLRSRLPESVAVEYVSPVVPGKVGRYVAAATWLWRRRGWLAEQDVVHCHLTWGAFLGAMIWRWRRLSRRRLPLVVETYHAVGMNIPPLLRRFHGAMATQRDAVVLMAEPDQHWRAFLERDPGPSVRLILNGAMEPDRDELDRQARLEYRREVGIPDRCRWVVGTVSMLRPDRKPWMYVHVFAEIARRLGPDVHCVIAGGGSEYERLLALVTEHGLTGRVHFPGVVSDPRHPLAIMDLYVTSNVRGVTGVAAIEAALTGVPVVAIQLDESYETRAGDWIWSAGDPVEVGRRAAELLRDGDARQALRLEQRRYAREYHSVEGMARAYELLYEELRGGPTALGEEVLNHPLHAQHPR